MSRHVGLKNGQRNGSDGKRGITVETAKPILRLNNIEVKYHEVILVLKGVSLEIPEGGIIALLGANGAGKSTTLKVIEGRKVFEHLTVEENLKVGAHLRKTGSVKEGLEMVYHYFPRLREKRSEVAGYVSGGEQQMTVIGRALMAQPKLMLLDEPSMGLAPLLIKEIFEIIIRLNHEEKIPILLVEQNVKLALTVSPYAYVLENGRLVMHDTSEKLKQNPDIRDFYLGLSDLGERKSFRHVKHYKRRKRWLT